MDYLNILLSAPETPLEWVLLIAACVVAAAIIGFAVFTAIKLVKNGKIDQLKDAIVAAIKEAEASHASGAEKKEMVVAAAKKFCDEIGLKINDKLLGWIVDYIDKYIFDHNELTRLEEEGEAQKAAAQKAEAKAPAKRRKK